MKKDKKDTRRLNIASAFAEMVVLLVVVGIYVFITQYFLLVPLNIHSVGFWFATIIGIGIVCGIVHFMKYLNDDRNYYESTKGRYLDFTWPLRILRIAGIVAIVALIILAIAGSTMFHATRYAELITISDGDEVKDIPDIETDELVVVDQKTAEKLGDRQLAFVENSTLYDVDDAYSLVKVNGSFYRISNINYGGFIKSTKANGIPAYIQVEATTVGDAQSSKAIEFTTPMVYSKSAYWSHDLERHLHFNYPTLMFGNSIFEVNDEDIPYFITPVKTTTIGLFGGVLEKSVVVTNAVTGACTLYSIDEAPEWVDQIHSADYLLRLVKLHYNLQGGFWNSIFGKSNVYNTSYEYRSSRTSKDESQYTPFDGFNWVIGKDGRIYIYTGITPANAAETNIGFVLIDPKTAEARFYEAAGAEESSAQVAAEGLVQNLRYSASFPTIIDINGEFAYFMSLKDNAGLVQKYAICNVKNYSKVVEANTIEQAIEKYTGNQVVSTVDEDEGTTDTTETFEISGNVCRVETAEKNGNTCYFFTLSDDEYVYVSSITNSSLQPFMLKTNQSVTIQCYDSTESGIRIVTSIQFK